MQNFQSGDKYASAANDADLEVNSPVFNTPGWYVCTIRINGNQITMMMQANHIAQLTSGWTYTSPPEPGGES